MPGSINCRTLDRAAMNCSPWPLLSDRARDGRRVNTSPEEISGLRSQDLGGDMQKAIVLLADTLIAHNQSITADGTYL
jgi:hypothetical protein